MHNYHTDLIWKIDAILVIISVSIALIAIIYAAIKGYLERRRTRALVEIKKRLFEMALADKKTCDISKTRFAENATPRQFIDVITNRNRDTVFFNESEQSIFRNCFASPKKMKEVEKIAKGSINKWRRIEAIMCLGYAEAGSALKIFEKSVTSRDNDISYFSVIALGQVKSIFSAKILLRALREKRLLRYKTASVLESFPGEIVDEVSKLTEDHDPSVRVWGLRLLEKFNAEKYTGKIGAMLTDESDAVRAAACDFLGAMGHKDVKDSLVKCLKDDDWLVRRHAVMALSNLLGGDAVPLVMSLINDGSLSVLDSVKEVLAKHIKSSLPYINRMLAGEDELAKNIANEALKASNYYIT